jgi:hypothetical protein
VTIKRSSERTEFLSDIITTAIEGGTGYWAQVSQYQYVMDGELSVCVGKRNGDGAKATIHELDEDDVEGSGYKKEGVVIDIDTIAHGIGLILSGKVGIHDRLEELLKRGNERNDAGDVDADVADMIVQAALFEEIRYG